MSYNTNMNNGTSSDDIMRVGKLEGKSTKKFHLKFAKNSGIYHSEIHVFSSITKNDF